MEVGVDPGRQLKLRESVPEDHCSVCMYNFK